MDELFPNGLDVHLLKMDVQGSECRALQGMTRHLAQSRVRAVWSAASPAAIVEDDDDTHSWKAGGSPVTKVLEPNKRAERGTAPAQQPTTPPPTPYCPARRKAADKPE